MGTALGQGSLQLRELRALTAEGCALATLPAAGVSVRPAAGSGQIMPVPVSCGHRCCMMDDCEWCDPPQVNDDHSLLICPDISVKQEGRSSVDRKGWQHALCLTQTGILNRLSEVSQKEKYPMIPLICGV